MGTRTVMTPLRTQIVAFLHEYRYLRTEHFYSLLEATTETRKRAIRRALQLMRQARLLAAGHLFEYRANSRGGFPHTSFVYYLAPRGAALAGECPSSVVSPYSLPHEIEITECHLALSDAIVASRHLELHWIQANTRKHTNPDAIFGLEDRRREKRESTHWFFLEVERSRQGHYRRGWGELKHSGLVQKLIRYQQYRRSPELKANWPFIADFRVLVVVHNELRARNLLEKLHVVLPSPAIWIITRDAVTDAFAAAVFATPHRLDERRSLADLFRQAGGTYMAG